MRCWNCHKKIPKGAKVCHFCEARVEDAPTADEMKAVGEALETLDDESRSQLVDLIQRSATADELIKNILVGTCPKCGSDDVGDCEKDPEIDDILVGRCYQCGQYWCLECERLLSREHPHCDCCDE